MISKLNARPWVWHLQEFLCNLETLSLVSSLPVTTSTQTSPTTVPKLHLHRHRLPLRLCRNCSFKKIAHFCVCAAPALSQTSPTTVPQLLPHRHHTLLRLCIFTSLLLRHCAQLHPNGYRPPLFLCICILLLAHHCL